MNRRSAPEVQLVDIDATNWREIANLAPHPEQQTFVADTTYYLCLSHFGQEWHCLGIESAGRIVGHIMWGLENDEGWIGGLVIDATDQGRGIGTAAMEAICQRLAAMPEVEQLALSYQPTNETARRLYLRLGFTETGEMEGDEVVARRKIR